ncbi:MAG TPA: hypothetical protein VH878_02495, partial [Thermodesulfobacteriota bacterium]
MNETMETDENLLMKKTHNILRDTFQEGFNKFNKGTFLILHNFLDNLLNLFKVYTKQMPQKFGPFIKFVVTSIAFGVDRAMYSLSNKDDLSFTFSWTAEDVYFKKLLKFPIAGMEETRNSFYQCFRRDGYDPRVDTRTPREKQNDEELEEATKKLKTYYEKTSNPKPILKTPPPVVGNPEVKTTSFASRDQIKVMSESETDIEFESDVETRKKKKINPPPAKPLHKYDESSDDESGNEDDASKPVVPVHIQEGDRDPHFGTPLAKVGKVYDPKSAYREVETNPSSEIWNQTLKGLTKTGLDKEAIQNVMVTSAAMAQIASTMTSAYKKQNKKVYEEIPPPSDMDLRPDSFDYNLAGKTLTQILGKRFCNIRFANEVTRLMVMRSILERVISHPKATYDAKMICANQLGEDDPLKRSKAEIQTIMADSFYNGQDTDEIVPPPRLGKNDLTSEALKALQTRIGMSPSDRFTIEDMSGIKLRTLLTNLGSVITSFGLRESEAYALMSRVTTGVTHEAIW